MAFLPYLPYPGKMPVDEKTVFPSLEGAYFQTPLRNPEPSLALAPRFLGRGIFAGDTSENQAIGYRATAQATGPMNTATHFTCSIKP